MKDPVHRDAPPIAARPASPDDAKDIWVWRNDPATRAASADQTEISWEHHLSWFKRALANPNVLILMLHPIVGEGMRFGSALATVRFERQCATSDCWRVSIVVRPDMRGLGLGRDVLLTACRAFFEAHGQQQMIAEIRSENSASRKIFEALGFRVVGNPRGELMDRFERPATPLLDLASGGES